MPRIENNLISSISTLYLAMLSFILIYIYVSVNLFEHNRAASNLAALDKLLALRFLSNPNDVALGDDVAIVDLTDFYSNAAHARIQEPLPPAEEGEEDYKATDKLGAEHKTEFTGEIIQGARIRRNVPMRLAVGAACDALVTKLSPGHEITISTLQYVARGLQVLGGLHSVKSENIRLVTFHVCGHSGNPEFNALIFSLDDGRVAYALPRSLEGKFPGLTVPRIFVPNLFKEIDKIKTLLPPSIAKYVELEDSFITVHARAIDHYILSYANVRLGKYFPVNDLENVAQKLFEESEKDTSYLGITTTSSSLVRLGPLIYFFMSFELWRRVRRLTAGKIPTEQYWFGSDTRDLVGRSYAYLCAFAPLLFGVLMYTLFATSQNVSFALFDRVVNLEGVVKLQFPLAFMPDGRSNDYLAFAIFIAFVLLHFFILVLTTRKLVHVIKGNLKIA